MTKRFQLVRIFFALLLVFFLFPIQSLAVDFSITNVRIDAYLQENGEVQVEEQHTYAFDGKFNGISRELFPKKGTDITAVQAFENGTSLEIEEDDHQYKIYRSGKDETIDILITYTIQNGVDKYQDVAEFYWAFFDDRNESTYEKMTIFIHPPASTDEVIAFGEDVAFQTETIENGGTVRFDLGEVPDEKNGNIRLAYDATLFPGLELTEDISMRGELVKAEEDLYIAAAKKAERQAFFSKVAPIVVALFLVILLVFIMRVLMKARLKKLEVERQGEQTFFVPKEKLSLPATIYYVKGLLPEETIAAALLDLVRKGIVEQTEKERFHLNQQAPATMLKHEKILTTLLFEIIGANGEFSFEDLKAFTDNTKNHEKFYEYQTKWQQAIIEETKDRGLYEKSNTTRWLLALGSLILLVFTILFGVYELLWWMLATIILLGAYLVFAITYKPRTTDGVRILLEWRGMKERLNKVSSKEWSELKTDEQMRIYLYGLGMNDKTLLQKNEELMRRFSSASMVPDMNLSMFLLLGPMAAANFRSAQESTAATISSSNNTSGGGGVGGGGGGSGAF